jgi:hypothetical protein
MIRQLLIGSTIAAAAGYSIPGIPDLLSSNTRGFASSSGAKWESAKFSLSNLTFTSAFRSPKVNYGSTDSNSITALIEASKKELARKNSLGHAGSAKTLRVGGSSKTGAKFIKN